MPRLALLKWLAAVALLSITGAFAYANRSQWMPLVTGAQPAAPTESESEHAELPIGKPKVLELSVSARKNMGLVSKPAKLQSYWRTLLIPGEIVDRPGVSDRGVTSPAVGVVTRVHAFPGDTVRPGETLFTIRLFSEYLQNTQSELFKSTRETELVKEQQARLEEAAKGGAIPEAKLIDLNNQLRRQGTLILAYRQDLLTRGLSPEQIQKVTEGQFVSTIDINAPPVSPARVEDPSRKPVAEASPEPPADFAYEVQELQVELGQQVQAGQLLAQLSNHNSLFVAGHAFKGEAPFLERAAQERRPIAIEFAEDEDTSWPTVTQVFEIRHLANSINTESRTFDFFIPLTNQSRSYEKGGEKFVVWRFRPGQRTRLHVPVEEYKNVFVVPASAVVHEGPEAYVFRQNGDLFDRREVHILYEDRLHAVVESGGNVTPGMYLAQSSAATLNRVMKSQSASGLMPGFHMHPDGTIHGPH